MKKKMSVLVALVMAVAVTSYSVSGTYAKYTSNVDLTDEARVAKWSFTATDKEGNPITDTNKFKLFADSYSYNGTRYVKSMTEGQNVVAPGTSGEYTFKFKGNMEVRYTLDFDIDATNDFIVYYKLADGKITEKKTRDEAIDASGITVDENTTTEQINQAIKAAGYLEYRPIRYSVVYVDQAGVSHEDIKDVTADTLETSLNAYNAKLLGNNGFGPGEMKQQYTISWKWDDVNAGLDEALINELDTFAGENLSDEADKVEFGVLVTATQLAENHSTVSAWN